MILAIGASWLPLSGKQIDYTNILAKRYAGKRRGVFRRHRLRLPKSKNLASTEEIRKFAATNKVGVPVLRDPDGSAT